jgi:hypothetical protein
LDLFCIIENLFGIPKVKKPHYFGFGLNFTTFGDPQKNVAVTCTKDIYIFIYLFGKNGPKVTIFGWRREGKKRVKITIFRP